MSVVELAGLRFGEGLPKICVPLTAGSMPALLKEARVAAALPADLYEWRGDSFFGGPAEALELLGKELAGKPLLCTVRTVREGGSTDVGPEEYEALLCELIETEGFQLIDVELSCGEDRVKRIIAKAREKGMGVVVSKHDFAGTPAEDEIVSTLLRMKELGADLPKIAVTPRNSRDVLALLSATVRAHEQSGPVVTMSMGPLGKVSRISGSLTGCCMTFGMGANASAPGQIETEDLRAILEDLAPEGSDIGCREK